MKKLKPTFKPGGALVYDDLKGKVISQVRVYQIAASTFVELLFEDKTSFHITLESDPLVRLSLYGEHENGDLKPISTSGKIPVPFNQ
jgi:hypothetical protein